MHVQKHTASAVSNLIAHYERANNEERNYSNIDIDKSRTHLNYNLQDNHGITGYEKYKNRLGEVYHINRKDVNTMVSIVVTLPKDYNGDVDKFFRDTKNYLDMRYGKDNCIGAYVHKDEKNIHMHYCFIPVVRNHQRDKGASKDYEYRLNAKKVIDRAELQRLHPDMQHYLRSMQPDKTINLITGAVAKQGHNLSVKELKLQSKTKQIERLEQKVSFREQEVQAKKKEITAKAQSIEKVEKTITAKGKELSEQSAQLDKDLQDLRSFANRPDKVEPVKVGISRKEYVPYKDYEKTYDTMSNALTAAERAESRVKQLSRQVTSQSKSLLEREVEAERSARQKAEDRARQAEDRLQAKEGDKDVASSQALYDVLRAVGINDWKEQQRLKKLYDKSEQEHFKQNRERELAHRHAHTHDRETYPER